MPDEFKKKLQRYYDGKLSPEEARSIEEELDKLDVYQQYIDEQTKDDAEEGPIVNETQIIKRGRFQQRFTVTAIVLTILLLAMPLLELGSTMYYANKAQDLVDVTTKTVYLTEPNIKIDEDEIDVKTQLFHLSFSMDLSKHIGGEDLYVGSWDVLYQLNEVNYPAYPDRNYIVESPPKDIPRPEGKKLFHPENSVASKGADWNRLAELPQGTVAEIYVSFNDLYQEGDLTSLSERPRVEWQWFAVNTGLEALGKSTEGGYLTPIGYPSNHGARIWSPMEGIDDNESSNQEQFVRVMNELEEYEEQATDIARTKWLDLSERNDYLDQHGVELYGGVLTGPVKELLRLKDHNQIRHMKIGEVRLWNYQ